MSSTSPKQVSPRDTAWRALAGFLVVSVLLHAAGLWGLAPLLEPASSPTPEPTSETRVELRSAPKSPPEPTPPPNRRERETEETHDRKAVTQKTNQKTPEEADYESKQANKVEEQTRARETTDADVQPGTSSPEKKKKPSRQPKGPRPEPKASESNQQAAEAPEQKPARRARAKAAPKERRVPTDESADRTQPAPSPSQPDAPLPMPSEETYARAAPRESKTEEGSDSTSGGGAGHELFRQLESEKGAIRAALNNHIPEIQPGNHTSVNAKASAVANYISAVHRDIHRLWGDGYLPRLDRQYGPGHPLSDTSLNTELELVIDGETGELKKISVIDSSGEVRFDSQAIISVRRVAPFPPPPDEAVSPNGHAYFHWNFWRDQRQCGTFGVRVFRLKGGKKTRID